MTNYFLSVGTKSILKNKKVFNFEDIRTDLLYDHYYKKGKAKRAVAKNREDDEESIFMDWFKTLFCLNYNIVLHGCQSKFHILDEFSNFLKNYELPDYSQSSKTAKIHTLNLTIVRLHGLTPISTQRFIHSVFGITENRNHNDQDLELFIKSLNEKQLHFVFFMHSFELLLKDNQTVCDIIFELYSLNPRYVHIVISANHVDSGILLAPLKYELSLRFNFTRNGESFFYEKFQSLSIIDNDLLNDKISENKTADNSSAAYNSNIFMKQVNLRTLKDVYSAMQKDCVKIMKFIIEYFVRQSKLTDQLLQIQESNNGIKFGSAGELASSKRLMRSSMKAVQDKNSNAPPVLEWDDLLNYYVKEFIVKRPQVLKGHVGELVDHRIIKLDESKTKIQCLLSVGTCEKFLEFLESIDN